MSVSPNGPQRPSALRYPLDRAHQRVQADGGFDRAQPSRASRDEVVACQRQLEPARQAQAVHGADHRQRALFECPQRGDRVEIRYSSASFEQRHVGAGREVPQPAFQQHRSRVVR
jgi:hypothetical protein